MHPKLSFEQAPPISVPFRFLMTAPWFGVLAGLLLLVRGGDGWASRWQVDVLVWTHLLAAGFMLQVMLGALLQFVPVATGGNIWRPRWVAAVAHPLITLAVLVLAATFLVLGVLGLLQNHRLEGLVQDMRHGWLPSGRRHRGRPYRHCAWLWSGCWLPLAWAGRWPWCWGAG